MTPIEDLLRQALRETPVAPSESDPLVEIGRRARKARRGIGAAAAVVVAVVAALVVPLVLVRSGGDASRQIPVGPPPSPTQPPSQGNLEVWLDQSVKAVTIAPDGTYWLAVGREDTDHPTWGVAQQTADGTLVRTIEVPGPIQGIAYGAGRVWAYRTGDGGYPDGVLDAVDPTTGDVATLTYPGGGPTSITFVDTAVYVSVLGEPNRIERIEYPGPSDTAITVASSVPVRTELGGVATVEATEDGHVWTYVQQRLVEVRDRGDRLALANDESFLFPSDGIRGHTGPSSLWIAYGPGVPDTLEQLDPGRYADGDTDAAYGDRIVTHGQPTAVVEDGVGGVYVGVSRRFVAGIAYYDAEARADGETVSAFRGVGDSDSGDIVAMAADPHGGVVAVTIEGQELHWDPTGG